MGDPSVQRRRTRGDYRGYAGQLASGALRRGEEVAVLPGGGRTRIAAIDTFDGELEEATRADVGHAAPRGRARHLARRADLPTPTRRRRSRASWRRTSAGWPSGRCAPGGRYLIKHTTRNATAVVDGIDDRRRRAHAASATRRPTELALNDIGRVRLRTSTPLVFDPYTSNRRTGSFILIDEATNGTVGAGMIAALGEPCTAPTARPREGSLSFRGRCSARS